MNSPDDPSSPACHLGWIVVVLWVAKKKMFMATVDVWKGKGVGDWRGKLLSTDVLSHESRNQIAPRVITYIETLQHFISTSLFSLCRV